VKLAGLLEAVDVEAVTGPANVPILGVVLDSRQVRPGFLFVAVPGHNTDGWNYLDDAVHRGAVGLVSEHAAGQVRDICHVQVADARDALARISCAFNGFPAGKMKIVGITGTNGKTTTAYMVRDILRAADEPAGLLSTVDYQVGRRVIPAARTTPEAPLLQCLLSQMVNAECRTAVMEVSSHSLDQKRTTGIDFDVAAFTNLTRDHLDYHGSMDAYFDAKSLLFRELGRVGKHASAVVNVDDPWGQRLADRVAAEAQWIPYGTGEGADVRAEELVLAPEGSRFRVSTPWGHAQVKSRLLGRYNVSNMLAAVAVCGALGIDLDCVAEAFSTVNAVPGRLEEIPTGKGFQVFVDYAHTDDALAHVLRTLREITRGRLLVVFGCGGNRDRSKRPAMGEVAADLADFTILTSDNPRKEDPWQIIQEIRSGFGEGSEHEIIEDRSSAIHLALQMASEGDVVLIAGKGHETFQEFANTTLSFDDRQVVRKALNGKSGH